MSRAKAAMATIVRFFFMVLALPLRIALESLVDGPPRYGKTQ
jgi:hypothetical protein